MTSIKQFIVAIVFFISFFTGCNFKPGHKVYTYPEQLLATGELTEASEVAQEILKSYNLSQLEKAKIDSIREMIYRIRQDYILEDNDVLSKLGKYHPYMDKGDLLRLEKMNRLDYMVIDGEKRYFKNCVSNVFRLDSAYARIAALNKGAIRRPQAAVRRRPTPITMPEIALPCACCP